MLKFPTPENQQTEQINSIDSEIFSNMMENLIEVLLVSKGNDKNKLATNKYPSHTLAHSYIGKRERERESTF